MRCFISFFVIGDTKCNNFSLTLKNVASVPHMTSLWQISDLSHSHSEHFCGYSDPFCTHSVSGSSLILPMSFRQCSYTCWKFEQKLWRMFQTPVFKAFSSSGTEPHAQSNILHLNPSAAFVFSIPLPLVYLLLSGMTFQTNYLHTSSCLKFSFLVNPKEDAKRLFPNH